MTPKHELEHDVKLDVEARVRQGVKAVHEEVLEEEMTQHLRAGQRELTPTGRGERNGSYQCNLVTPAGKIERLEVPRDREGQFVTEVFERYKRMTGDVEEAILEMQEVLAIEVAGTEKGGSYASMLRGLLDRGLEGVRLVISDDHESIKSAVAGELPGVEWQRCVVHFERNVLTSVPAGAMGEVAEDLKAIFKVKRSKTARALAEGFVERWKPVGTTPDPSFRAILSGVGEDVDLETVLY